MTSFTDTMNRCSAFADALDGLANDGRFSETERDDFALLHLMYQKRLMDFTIRPAHGDASPHYDRSAETADEGAAAAAAAMQGDPASKQPVFDAAHGGAKALADVTGSGLRARRVAR